MLKSNNIKSFSFKDQVIFEEREVVKNDGTPYVVYTPYSKKWMAKAIDNVEDTFRHYPSEDHIDKITGNLPVLPKAIDKSFK